MTPGWPISITLKSITTVCQWLHQLGPITPTTETMDLQHQTLYPSNTITSSLRNKNNRNDPELTNFHYTKVYYYSLPTVTCTSTWPSNAYRRHHGLTTYNNSSNVITFSLRDYHPLKAAS